MMLTKRDAVCVKAIQKIGGDNPREAGDRWMEYGPKAYLPPVEVEIIRQVEEYALDQNEGVYIRDTKTGEKKAIIGKNYMLGAHEERYHKKIPEMIADILGKHGVTSTTDLITYECPFNACVQVFNYRQKTSRIVWGPKLVKLEPDELFTVNILSGDKPKVAGKIRSIHIELGPEFTSDVIEVETSDHCRLNIKLSYNWYFDVEKGNNQSGEKIFAVRDFIGNMCLQLASKIRSAVAQISFNQFHENSANIIRTCVFGRNDNNKVNEKLTIPTNNLTITNIDIKEITPIDRQTRNALQQTVSLSIENTNKTQEDKAIREFETEKVKAEGTLKRTKLRFETLAKKEEAKLIKF